MGRSAGGRHSRSRGAVSPKADVGTVSAPVFSPRPLAHGDDRALFDCGRPALNEWFRRHAWNNHANGASRVNVIADVASGRIVGYVALSSSQIERAFLPKSRQRNQPDPVPVTLLGQLAVDSAWRGQGHGLSLLQFALRTALKASDSVGSTAVITHPLDESLRGFYARWGFIDLAFDPQRAMIARMADIRRRLEASSSYANDSP
jgi:predicted GNAT family N-acyltransferase